MIVFVAGSTVFWTFLYSQTLFLIDLAVNFLFLQLATSERLSKTDKCPSHLRFPVGRPWDCSFVNFEISNLKYLKYLISNI